MKIGSIRKIIYTIMLFVLIRPYGLYVYSQLDTIYYYGKIAICAILIFHMMYLILIKNQRPSNGFLLSILFFMSYFLSYIVNHKSVVDYLNENIVVISLCLWIEIVFRRNQNINHLIQPLLILHTVYVSLDFVTHILYPHGIAIYYNTNTAYWFLGTKNLSIRYIIPFLIFAFSNKYKTKQGERYFKIYAWVISAFIIAVSSSATAIMGLATFSFVYYFIHYRGKMIKLRAFVIADVVFFTLIVKLRLQNLFAFFIVGVLHKDLTFTNRTLMWDHAFEALRGHDLFGVANYNVVINAWRGESHPHNYVLYILLCGGLLLLGILGVMLLQGSRSIEKTYDYVFSRCLLCGISSFLIMANTESLIGAYLFIPLVMTSVKLKQGLNETALRKKVIIQEVGKQETNENDESN